MHEVFETAKRFNLALRIHGFEGQREGEFYDALWSDIEKNLESLRELRIGHLSKFTNEDLARLVGISKAKRRELKRKLVFEANVESNVILQDASPQALASTIRQLLRHHYKVVLGTDGIGPLGSRLETGIRLLAPYLHANELIELWQNTVGADRNHEMIIRDILAKVGEKREVTHSPDQKLRSARKRARANRARLP